MLTLLALSVPVAVACQVATQYLFAIDKIRERLFVGLGGALIMLLGMYCSFLLTAARVRLLCVLSYLRL